MNDSGSPLPDALQEWVAGWYWRTDELGRLLTFRPGASAAGAIGATGAEEAADVRLNWQALSDHVALRPAWLALWDISQHNASAWQHMAYLMSQGLGWSQPLSLPWPAALPGWWPARESRPGMATVQLRASPLRDARGVCVGFQGVCQPVLEAVVHPQAPSGADEPGMSPAEQEALRYALSHDLRAPLRVVDGFSRIVKEDYAVALGKLGLDHLDRVLAASARMSGMIDAILSQAQLGSTGLQRQVADVSAMAMEVCHDLQASHDNGPVVAFEVEPGLSADADPVMLRRVLDNLIGNAVKYSAKVAQPRVSVGCMPSTHPAVFFVKDNGAGFDMQHADKLFGMFQRLHSAKDFPGTGVGLAGVQQIVRRHGGRIWAEARPGEGACFYFTLMDIATAQQKLV
jgi:signal transduction histidine kinase